MNRAVFDAITRYFGDAHVAALSEGQNEKIVSELKRLCADDVDFRRSIEQTTKTPLAVGTRLGTWGRALAKIIGKEFDAANYRIGL